jgi:hypothetical protein
MLEAEPASVAIPEQAIAGVLFTQLTAHMSAVAGATAT